jgi:hypothetical protein
MTAVITALTGYSIETIKPYVESLNNTGFNATKIVVYYDPIKEVSDYLENNGWEVYTDFKLKYHINFQRFKDIASLIEIKNLEEHLIVFTDIRDVYFKRNPSELNTDFYIGADIFSPIKNHKWNADAIKEGFSRLYGTIKDNYPLCAGVIKGPGKVLGSFFRDVFDVGINSDYKNLVDWCAVDQAAVNILAYTKYRSKLKHPDTRDRVVLNMANLKNFKSIEDYSIYHQYDRHKKFMEHLVVQK